MYFYINNKWAFPLDKTIVNNITFADMGNIPYESEYIISMEGRKEGWMSFETIISVFISPDSEEDWHNASCDLYHKRNSFVLKYLCFVSYWWHQVETVEWSSSTRTNEWRTSQVIRAYHIHLSVLKGEWSLEGEYRHCCIGAKGLRDGSCGG